MKFGISVVVVVSLSLSGNAFVTPKTGRTTTTTTTELFGLVSTEHVKKQGGGVPVIPSGDKALFDPGMEGMLGGTHNLEDRLSSGAGYVYHPPLSSFLDAAPAQEQQVPEEWIQTAEAWLEDLGIPSAFAKPTAPVTATVLGRTKLITDDAPGNIQHVILKLPEGFHYIEGQSLSVIPPGQDAKGKPHKPRLYSIASTRYGDLLDGQTVSLCVRQAEYTDPATGQVDPTKAGVCSTFLCSAEAGQTVQVAGPVGKTMVLPDDPTTDIIMVATGTGIAPFRAFLHRLFVEDTIARHQFQANAWLILGVPVTGGLLYPEEFTAMQQSSAQRVGGVGQLKIDYAISREMTNAQGGKLYVQHVLEEQADVLLQKLENGAHIYFCGLKGMMPGILESLEQVAQRKGLDWSTLMKKYQSNHQWHVEVY